LHPVGLTGTLISSDAIFGQPSFIAVMGDELWLADHTGDPFFHVIDIPTGKVQVSLGRHGEGPGEFEDVFALSIRPGDTLAVWAYDPQRSRFTRLTAPRAQPVAPKIMIAPNGHRPLKMVWLSPNRLLSVSMRDTGRFTFTDSGGRVLSVVAGRLLGTSKMPRPMRISRSAGLSVCSSPTGGGFAVTYIAASRIEYYDSLGTLRGTAHVPFPNDGDFVQDERGAWHNSTPRYYYRECSATAARLYALFSGRLNGAVPPGTFWEGEYVHVFDWSGDLIRVFHLDHLVEYIAIVGDSLLYASGQDTGGVYRYLLPPLSGSVATRP
jgi:TolB-like 6-blade propeller-like